MKSQFYRGLLLSAAIILPAQAWAQTEAPQAESAAVDEIVVTSARATQRSSIETKRTASVIVDGIVNDEIGALPDNSVADTLERITGVTADRFKGNANELSVRGLGPTLSFSTFNGREVSTAGPDRSVAFQQFPSELVNGVLVYKSQQADFLEGGLAGVIELKSIRPIDYGRRRIQMEVRGAYLPKDDDIRGRNGLGYRGNISYTDSWDTKLGEMGVSIGYQRLDQATPEDYYITNSAFVPCTTYAAAPGTSTANCSNAATAPTGSTIGPRYFATSARTFQAKVTDEVRKAVMGTFQWKPTPNLDISLDGQYSTRNSGERRNQLAITEGLRGIQPLLVGDGGDYSNGALMRYSGNSNLEIQLENRQRNEKYIGGGGAVTWTPTERLTVSGDLSYSQSHRTELQKATNMRSANRVAYTLDATGDEVPSVTFTNFDVSDPSNFLIATPTNNSNYARYRQVTDRFDKIGAVRADVTYELAEDGFFQSIKFGGRLSDHRRTQDANNNADVNLPVAYDGRTPAQLVAAANANCRTPFVNSNFMDGKGNVRSWALFDNDCLFRTYTGRDSNPLPSNAPGPEDSNIRERISTAYVMTNFRTQLGDTPVSGNAGVRYVRTRVLSKGFRGEVTVTPSTGGSAAIVIRTPGTPLEEIEGTGGYEYFLPSANVAFDLSDVMKLRLAAYKGLSRSGIEDFNVGITPVADANGTTVESVLVNSTTGNPNLKPIRGWNLDASLEFYVNRDTSFAVATYYKWLTGAAFDAREPLPTTIIANGQPVTFNAIAPANDPNTRELYGIEFSGNHAFTYLPGLLSGFGVSGSLAITEADFEFADPSTVGPYVDPANLIGLSKYTGNGSVFWENDKLSLRASYRYRSNYFKPNSGSNRSVKGSGFLNLSATYDLTKQVQLKLQALNVTNTRDIMFKPGEDSITEVSDNGPQIYFGVRMRF
ncbi:TonB-dependent receptor [Caulobacter sp.]|uniref:TonB-dependent receptor n=1 Tax=Caulobacter sp. TaxID=78 RepID=UPI001607AEBA